MIRLIPYFRGLVLLAGGRDPGGPEAVRGQQDGAGTGGQAVLTQMVVLQVH